MSGGSGSLSLSPHLRVRTETQVLGEGPAALGSLIELKKDINVNLGIWTLFLVTVRSQGRHWWAGKGSVIRRQEDS